ncbi:IclR family transcriptional regulator [soil metagenome]
MATRSDTSVEADDAGPPVKAIDRAARLLRALGTHPFDGAAFSDLARETGFGKATTHRLLAALGDTGFVYQDIATRRYRLGSAFAMLGLHALTQLQAAASQASLDKLAQSSDDTVFAQVPEGTAAVCIARATGGFPIRTLTLNVGDRRPLGVGAGSLALLAAMPDDQLDKVLERNLRWLKEFPVHTPKVIAALVAETRRNGFAFNTGRIVSGMHAVGVPVLDAKGSPIASLSIAAITERMSTTRAEQLVRSLKKEAAILGKQLKEKSA